MGCRVGVLIGTVSKMFLRPRVTHETAYLKLSRKPPVSAVIQDVCTQGVDVALNETVA